MIDLNCDCGESYGAWTMGDDAAVMPHITSANIACGAHAGDPLIMQRTVQLAMAHGVGIGAHVGYPDRQGFGRRVLPLAPEEIHAGVLVQIGALEAIARAAGARLTHVKPHGALYNRAAADVVTARAVVAAVAAFDRTLVWVGLAGSVMVDVAANAGLRVAREAFADRAYEADGTLRPRSLPGALIEDDARGLAQALDVALRGRVTAHDGTEIPLQADTLCIHGDMPGAAARAARLRSGLSAANVDVVALWRWI